MKIKDLMNEVNSKISQIIARDSKLRDEASDADDLRDLLQLDEYIMTEYFVMWANDYVSQVFHDIVENKSFFTPENTSKIIEEINFNILAQDGGYEGGAESCHTILSLGDKFYRVYYAYYSGEGFQIDTSSHVTEVEPRQVEVTQYFDVGEE